MEEETRITETGRGDVGGRRRKSEIFLDKKEGLMNGAKEWF